MTNGKDRYIAAREARQNFAFNGKWPDPVRLTLRPEDVLCQRAGGESKEVTMFSRKGSRPRTNNGETNTRFNL